MALGAGLAVGVSEATGLLATAGMSGRCVMGATFEGTAPDSMVPEVVVAFGVVAFGMAALAVAVATGDVDAPAVRIEVVGVDALAELFACIS